MQGSEQTPKAPLGNNARPLQPLHHRTIRTNIDFSKVNKSNQPICNQYYRPRDLIFDGQIPTYNSTQRDSSFPIFLKTQSQNESTSTISTTTVKRVRKTTVKKLQMTTELPINDTTSVEFIKNYDNLSDMQEISVNTTKNEPQKSIGTKILPFYFLILILFYFWNDFNKFLF